MVLGWSMHDPRLGGLSPSELAKLICDVGRQTSKATGGSTRQAGQY